MKAVAYPSQAPSWVERAFAEFVRNANAVGDLVRTTRAPVPQVPIRVEVRPQESRLAESDDDQTITVDHDSIPTRPDDPSQRILLLTRKKLPSVAELEAELRPAGVVRLPSPDHRLEAVAVVPRVAELDAASTPVPERSEAGRIPAHELDRTLRDMEVLLRYGHREDVRQLLTDLRGRYPDDLLLMRRLAEFYVRVRDLEQAFEHLFGLAACLFRRGNLHGMRCALEEVLVLEPQHPGARRLLSLLDARET